MNKLRPGEGVKGYRKLKEKHDFITRKLFKAVDSCDKPAFLKAAGCLMCFYQDTLECGDKQERDRRIYWIRGEWLALKEAPKRAEDWTKTAITELVNDLFADVVERNAAQLTPIFEKADRSQRGRRRNSFAIRKPIDMHDARKEFVFDVMPNLHYHAQLRQLKYAWE